MMPDSKTQAGVQAPRANVPAPIQAAPATGRDVTRYLCAAVQQNDRLARRAIDSIIDEPHRPVASSPGVDLACVLRYALAARRRQTILNVVLAAITIVMVIALPFIGVGLFVLFILAWLIVLGDVLTTYYRVIGPQLNRRDFDPAKAPDPFEPDLRERLADIEEQQRGSNVTVFPAYEPFIGHGRRLDMWNFVVATDRPDENFDSVTPFTLNELYENIATGVRALGLKHVTLSERLFVSGADVQVMLDDRGVKQALLPDRFARPNTRVDAELLNRLREEGDGRARPYLVLEVNGWGGELVVTTMLRFTLSPTRDLLFVEGGTWLLAPINSAYHTVDYLTDRPLFHQLRALAWSALGRTPGQLLRSVPAVASMVASPFLSDRKEREQRREIDQQSFNYGALMSIREETADRVYHHYFQNVDRQLYAKAVMRRAMDQLTDFLKQHHVDVSDLREQQNVIYNSGIFASGDSRISICDTSMAVGMNARAMVGVRQNSANKS